MAVYDRIFASFYDRGLQGAEEAGLAQRREHLVGAATGRVIEIGAGTGLNLAHYPQSLDRLVLTEPSEPMASRLRERASANGRDAEVVIAPAEALPFDDGEFDTAVATLVFCTVPDPEAALREVRRVLAPGGKLLLIEHVRSDDPGRARWQDRLETPWRIFGNGCHCNRDTESLVKHAGFEFEQIDHGKLPKSPPIVRPLIEGRAVSV